MRDQLDKEGRNRENSLQIMRDSARAELTVAKRMLDLVEYDSRIGYESSNHYFYIPQDLMEKIIGCRYVLEQLN